MTQETKSAIIKIIFSACVASPIGYFFQWKYHQYENHLNLLQENRQQAMDYLMEIASLMDHRIYAMDKCYKALKYNKSKEEIDKSWNNYKNLLDEWNGSLNKNLVLTDHYFSKNISDDFANIHREFVSLGKKLDTAKRKNGLTIGNKSYETHFLEINKKMSLFLKNSLNEIKLKSEEF